MRTIEAGHDDGGPGEAQGSAARLSSGEQIVARRDLRVVSQEPVSCDPPVPRFKDYFAQLGLERAYGKPAAVTRMAAPSFLADRELHA